MNQFFLGRCQSKTSNKTFLSRKINSRNVCMSEKNQSSFSYALHSMQLYTYKTLRQKILNNILFFGEKKCRLSTSRHVTNESRVPEMVAPRSRGCCRRSPLVAAWRCRRRAGRLAFGTVKLS